MLRGGEELGTGSSHIRWVSIHGTRLCAGCYVAPGSGVLELQEARCGVHRRVCSGYQRDLEITLTAEGTSAAWSCFLSGLQRAPWDPLIDQPCIIPSG